MTAFEEYLALHEIDPISLSVEAKVRYGTIYNAKKGNPITLENAQRIKAAVLRVTSVPYTGSFAILEQPAHQLPFPIKKTYLRQYPQQGNTQRPTSHG